MWGIIAMNGKYLETNFAYALELLARESWSIVFGGWWAKSSCKLTAIHGFRRGKISLTHHRVWVHGVFFSGGWEQYMENLCVHDIDKMTWFWWDYDKLWINTTSSSQLVWRSATNDDLLFDVNVGAWFGQSIRVLL